MDEVDHNLKFIMHVNFDFLSSNGIYLLDQPNKNRRINNSYNQFKKKTYRIP